MCLKALLVWEDGSICASGCGRYVISTSAPGYTEQNPKKWWRALKELLAQARNACPASPEEIRCTGPTRQMHGTVLVGCGDELLAPEIIWCDQRSAAQVRRIRDNLGKERLGQWTQNLVAVGFLAVPCWVQKNEPALYRKIVHMLPKEYIRFLLTGQYDMELTDDGSKRLFDCVKRAWSGEMLDRLQNSCAILLDVLSAPVEVPQVCAWRLPGNLNSEWDSRGLWRRLADAGDWKRRDEPLRCVHHAGRRVEL